MTEQKPVNLCDRHVIPYAFTSDNCPMCTFLQTLEEETRKAFQAGFLKGVEAGKIEARKSFEEEVEEEIKEIKEEEDDNTGRKNKK